MLILFACIFLLGTCTASEWKRSARNGLTCDCGSANRGRIVGGTETRRNEYPLMVSLETMDNFWDHSVRVHACGGSIITAWHVLTAAHCTSGLRPNDITVSVGGHNRTGQSEARIRVSRIINHEQYNRQRFNNDIAILVTATEIRFTQNVGPVCMPNRRLNLVGQRVRAVGWGDMENGGRPAQTLRHVDLTVISIQRCMNIWAGMRPAVLEATNMCTLEPNRDTCQGDSGGPLLHTDPQTNRLTLAALVSYGGYCGGDYPAINTDVSAYVDWINRHVSASREGARVCTRA